MSIITNKGKLYETGKIYATETGCGKLTGFIEEDDCFEIMNDNKYTTHSMIYELNSGLGTIKDAPIEPKDKHWYMCEDPKGRQAVLYYRNCGWLDSQQNPVSEVTPLYEMVRA